MAALPLPAAILDDLICGTNEVIQDGDRKRKGRHFPPPPQWGSKKPPYTTDNIIAHGCLGLEIFTKQMEVLPQDLVKSRSREIWV